ncbi:MAG: hypothetical protein ACREOQ_17830 [Gemmatimonadales bacterium]
MSGRGARAIYFAAGSPNGPHGSVYKLWGIDGRVRPDGPTDFYLADRSSGDFLKTSFHESGKWRTAVTDAALKAGKVALPAGADRKVTEWDRPAMHPRGFVGAYKVGVPSSELRTSPLELPKAPVHWVADPGPGKAVQFLVLLVASHIPRLTLSGPGLLDERLHDQFRLPSGETLALMSRSVPLSEEAIAMVRGAVGHWTVQNPDGGPVDPDARVRCTMIVEDVDGGEAVLDLAIPCLV